MIGVGDVPLAEGIRCDNVSCQFRPAGGDFKVVETKNLCSTRFCDHRAAVVAGNCVKRVLLGRCESTRDLHVPVRSRSLVLGAEESGGEVRGLPLHTQLYQDVTSDTVNCVPMLRWGLILGFAGPQLFELDFEVPEVFELAVD